MHVIHIHLHYFPASSQSPMIIKDYGNGFILRCMTEEDLQECIPYLTNDMVISRYDVEIPMKVFSSLCWAPLKHINLIGWFKNGLKWKDFVGAWRPLVLHTSQMATCCNFTCCFYGQVTLNHICMGGMLHRLPAIAYLPIQMWFKVTWPKKQHMKLQQVPHFLLPGCCTDKQHNLIQNFAWTSLCCLKV